MSEKGTEKEEAERGWKRRWDKDGSSEEGRGENRLMIEAEGRGESETTEPQRHKSRKQPQGSQEVNQRQDNAEAKQQRQGKRRGDKEKSSHS